MLLRTRSFIVASVVIAVVVLFAGLWAIQSSHESTTADREAVVKSIADTKTTKEVIAWILGRMGCNHPESDVALQTLTTNCYDEELNGIDIYFFSDNNVTQQVYAGLAEGTCTGFTTMKMDRAVIRAVTDSGAPEKLKKLLPITATDTQFLTGEGCPG